jgi:(E)-4-hydroxy-3-methylbut-2-enyl-diphosphate synthase
MTDDATASTAYLSGIYTPTRRPTRVVLVGDVPVGGDNPIRVQSMTTSYTHDVPATLEQIEQLVAGGCEIVRVTVPTMKDAEALPAIRAGMKQRGISAPLVADIHFSPKLALLAAEHVEKVRVNPGNFTDSKRFAEQEYTDEAYAAELARVEERFTPLVLKCKARGIAMRIGTNHGSLSDRVMNRYGDSPLGMAESAMEFVRICRQHEYHDLIISMKASNTRVMTEAYRLLAAKMDDEGMDYPFHLGVTEAGDGDPARIKSAIGIGGLLLDGIGDTIRVSLTEHPTAEVPVGFALANLAHPLPDPLVLTDVSVQPAPHTGPMTFLRRSTRRAEQGRAAAALGADQDVRVEVGLGRPSLVEGTKLVGTAETLCGPGAGERRAEILGLDLTDAADVDALVAARGALDGAGLRVALHARAERAVWSQPELRARVLDVADRLTIADCEIPEVASLAREVAGHEDTALGLELEVSSAPEEPDWDTRCTLLRDQVEAAHLAGLDLVVVALRPRTAADARHLTPAGRLLAAILDAGECDVPLVLHALAPPDSEGCAGLLLAATTAGGLLVDGIGDALAVDGPLDPRRSTDLAFGILQGARRRTTETEFISCPGCGRTLFELEPVTAQIKELTGHLKGLKIGIMGCVVNGPGEMADADFGYVGWKVGKVNLYVGQECVVRDVPEDEAPDRLVELIKEHGRWVEPAVPLPVA